MLPQLEEPWRILEEGRRDLVEQVRALPSRVREKPLQEGGWSPLQALEHLMLVEKAVVQWIRSGREPGPFSLKNRLSKLAMWGFFALKLKTRAPMKQLVPQESPDLETIASGWSEAHRDLAGYLETVAPETLRQPVFRHPYAGAMDLLETLRFLELHQLHHHRQISADAR